MTEPTTPVTIDQVTDLALPPSENGASPLAGAIATAEAAAARAGVQLRQLTRLDEFQAVERLYDEIWRPEPTNPPVTGELMRALTKAGNYVGGAYDGDELVGASIAFFSAPADAALHSHIAGVSARMRGRSVGFALKLHQRAWALRRGVSVISWTFDPLVRRNAFFNLGKLGAVPAEYLRNFYGDMRDELNGTDDTDRLLVAWHLADEPVATACAGRPRTVDAGSVPGAMVGLSASPDHKPEPGQVDAAGPVLIGIPADIEALRLRDPGVASQWRAAVRTSLGELMDAGARVTGFDRAGWYVVERVVERGVEHVVERKEPLA